MKNEALAVVGGLIAGNVVGALWPLSDPAPIERQVTVLRPAPKPAVVKPGDPCPTLREGQEAALENAWAALESVEAEQRAMEEGLAELIGEPLSFEGTPEDLRPETIEDTVLDLLDEEVSELQWVDCSEAPCIAVLRMHGPLSDDPEGMRRAADPLRDAVGSDWSWEWFGVEHGEFITVPLGPSGDALANHRTDLREELIIQELLGAGLAR